MSDTAGNFWPPVPDFNPMLQNPNVGFSDAELKTCQIEVDKNKQPRPRAGNFAVCYKGTFAATGKHVCLRLFARKSEDRRERYAEISAHLKTHPIDCLVKFEYIEKGIRHPNPAKYGNKSWFPIIRMDWVEGSILFDWLREKCRASDAAAISRSADQWLEVAQQLESVGIAHCDLQHANVMVTPDGHLKLVDYDCMCVPGLVGRPNLELGVEPYQHPDRNEATLLFPGLDHFSELFILVVLRALAADPTLWFRHIEPPGGEVYDKLLIRKSDFEAPDTSALFGELQRSPNPEVGRLTRELVKMTKVSLDAVPSLSTFVFDFEEVRKYFARRAWDEGLDLLNRAPLKNLPKDIEATAVRARQHVQARVELDRALQAGDEQQIQAAYKPHLLDDYPKAQAGVQAAKSSRQVQTILGQLEAARNSHQWKNFVAVWDANESVLRDRKSADKYRGDAASWRERNTLCATLIRLKSAVPIDGAALEQACRALIAKGGHPEIDAEIPTIQQLVQRLMAFEQFQSVSGIAGEANDLALVAAWNDPLFAGWKQAEAERPRVTAANERLGKIRKLRKAVNTADAARSVDHEQAIRTLAQDIPAGYEVASELRARLASADAIVAAVQKIEQTLTLPAPPERVLLQCGKVLARLKAAAVVTPTVLARLELAAQRVPVLDKLAAVNLRGPIDVVDEAIRTAWNKHLLVDCPDAAPWRQRASEAFKRAGLLAQLDAALTAADDATAISLLDDPLLKGYPFGAALDGRIVSAKKKNANVRAMIDALRDHCDEDFGKYFDHRVLKANLPAFTPFQTQIRDVVRREILPVAKLGLSKPLVGPSISSASGGSSRYQVKWAWPAQRFTDQCLLGICQGMPDGQADPAAVAIHKIPIDRHRWEAGGGVYSLTAKSEWKAKRADVLAVWAVIDLGFSTFYSEPLVLGRVIHHEGASG